MVSIVARLAGWMRRTAPFAEHGFASAEAAHLEPAGPEPIYRLRKWPPSLPKTDHTVATLRLLSVMSTRPVNRGWMVRHTQLPASAIDQLIERLCRDGDVEVIDPSGFAPMPART